MAKSRYSADWFNYEPEQEELMHGSYRLLSPCEVLRHIYQLTKEENVDLVEIRRLLRVATTMSKSMAKRITMHEGRGWGRKVYPLTPWWEAGKPGCVMPGRRG
jgi:hypothetical protein